MRSTTFSTILLVFTGLAASCATPPSRSPQVRFADNLAGVVVVEQPVRQRTLNDLLKVTLPIRNISGDDLELSVQVEFLDAAGNRYNDDTPRRVLLIPRGHTRPFEASSMLSKADDFIATIGRSER